jgi:pilus assembly protein CpaC
MFVLDRKSALIAHSPPWAISWDSICGIVPSAPRHWPFKPGRPLRTPLDGGKPSNDLEFFLLGALEVDSDMQKRFGAGEGVIGPYGHIVELQPEKRNVSKRPSPGSTDRLKVFCLLVPRLGLGGCMDYMSRTDTVTLGAGMPRPGTGASTRRIPAALCRRHSDRRRRAAHRPGDAALRRGRPAVEAGTGARIRSARLFRWGEPARPVTEPGSRAMRTQACVAEGP